MKKIHILFAVMLIAFAFSGCDPNDRNSNSNDDFAENFGNAANRSFIGQVIDADNNPIQNASVKIGTSTVQTDINGVFIINDASVYEKFAHITVTKAGFIDGSRSMVPTSGKNNVKIMLIPNTPIETIQSGVASDVALPNGTKVNFDGAFQDENGAGYTGSVQVSMFHLKPSDENLNNLMPGMLYAQRENGSAAVLETFGMLNVELRGSAGQKLNLANGHTAQITMHIDNSQLATAPSSIPLWHFDEEGGYWKEDGVATKVGNNYVGTVSHFSWWNFDLFDSLTYLSVRFVDSNGNPLSDIGVGLSLINNDFDGSVLTTDNNGQISGVVPANRPLFLGVYDTCGNLIHTYELGSLSGNTVLPDIVIGNSVAQSTTVKGSLLKCDSSNVTNGYVIMHYGASTKFSLVTNGTFSFNTLLCTSNNIFTVKGFDYDNLQTTGNINYTLQAPETNIGTLSACNSVDEFITFTVDNEQRYVILDHFHTEHLSMPTVPYFLYGNYLQSTYPKVLIRTALTTTGVYPLTNNGNTTSAQIDINFIDGVMQTAAGLESGSILTINNYGEIGEYVDMTFSGHYTEGPPGFHVRNVTGVVHIKRTQ